MHAIMLNILLDFPVGMSDDRGASEADLAVFL
jgi:hypothetical protein